MSGSLSEMRGQGEGQRALLSLLSSQSGVRWTDFFIFFCGGKEEEKKNKTNNPHHREGYGFVFKPSILKKYVMQS